MGGGGPATVPLGPATCVGDADDEPTTPDLDAVRNRMRSSSDAAVDGGGKERMDGGDVDDGARSSLIGRCMTRTEKLAHPTPGVDF